MSGNRGGGPPDGVVRTGLVDRGPPSPLDPKVARMAASLAVELVPPPEGSLGRDPLQALIELLVNAWLRAKTRGNVP